LQKSREIERLEGELRKQESELMERIGDLEADLAKKGTVIQATLQVNEQAHGLEINRLKQEYAQLISQKEEKR